ncbi:uncharacterized protein EV154DRAFT_548079 [Mucor mucedo]|uniref:uncharacterized protein n=1 Tax=Mucor mucedo TaxID=29922 RepID=UPI00221F3B9C|nr:uncharacterized protein EV154DRAFT_548079 [Mucor mucedo]KAI7895735.1 hypothetical protein EV154DRAFT_548079 [Mucor mucedo]
MDEISDTTYALYKCSPLCNFLTGKRNMRYFRKRIAKQLSDDLDWVIDHGEIQGEWPHAGKITRLLFETLEMEDFETDQTYKTLSPLQLTLDCYVKGKISKQSMVMLPTKVASEVNEVCWNYPLMLAKISKGVYSVLSEMFLSDFQATISPLDILPKTMEHIICLNAEPLFDIELEDPQIHDGDAQSRSRTALLLEYSTGLDELKTIQLELSMDQVAKISALAGGPDKFYNAFCEHILNTTHIKLTTLHLTSLSCDILTVSLESGKIKFRGDGPRYSAYKVLYHLLEIAYSEISDFSWA